MTPGRWPSRRAWVAVAVGGIAGTELRYCLGLLFPEESGAIPWTTLAINVVGSFVLAFLTTFWLARPHTSFALRAGIGPGLVGSFTTFSAVAYAVNGLTASGAHLQMLAYVGLSLVFGLGAAAAGWRLGRAIPVPVLQPERADP